MKFSRWFWDKCTEWDENNLYLFKVKSTDMQHTHTHLRPKFLCVYLYDKPLSSYSPILRKIHRMTQIWPWNDQGLTQLLKFTGPKCNLPKDKVAQKVWPYIQVLNKVWVLEHNTNCVYFNKVIHVLSLQLRFLKMGQLVPGPQNTHQILPEVWI